MNINDLTENIIQIAIKVYKKLGSDSLESVYQTALAFEFKQSKMLFEKDKKLPLKFENIKFNLGFQYDFLVESCVIVECLCVNELTVLDEEQLLNFLKATNIQKGILINFKSIDINKGLSRIVNN